MSQQLEMQWYVLRAIGGKEKKVKEYLEAEVRTLKLQDYVAQVLIPTEKYYTVLKSGKKSIKERVSLPGYVLVQCAFTGEIPFMLRSIPGVIGFLSDDKDKKGDKMLSATPLREAEVNRLLGRVDEMEEAEEICEITFLEGEMVKVTDGPFASFIGTIETVDNARKKLTVSVKIFGRKTPMELGFNQVEKDLAEEE
ncbi:MAG: transcription termination/antitermination protein NusG [Rikenellaceae bacterium]